MDRLGFRTRGRMPPVFQAVCLALILAPALPAAVPDADRQRWPRVYIDDTLTAARVRWSLNGASRWLEDTRCQAVFSDFEGQDGRPLNAKLSELGRTGQDYLGLVLFLDGTGKGKCRQDGTLAYTAPGHRVVYVCGRQFVKEWSNDPRRAQAAVIHEALHTLGLGENPPSSQAITYRVTRLCSR